MRGRPGSIKALTAEKLPGSEVRLSWKRPEEDGGVGVDYYQVERAEAGSVESWLACGRSKENGFVVKGMLSVPSSAVMSYFDIVRVRIQEDTTSALDT